jgi:RNA polymerase sigma-70 factor (ECF subfamily)
MTSTHVDRAATADTITRISTRADFEALFHAHYSTLCSYANNFLKDLASSEEIVQEVMVRVWMNRETIVFESSPASYLYRAVRNGCLNFLSHLETREAYRSHAESQTTAWERSQEDQMIISELEQRIREAIDRLPLGRRKMFILSRYEGLTYNEIAARLSVSVKTVENQMSSALRFLREELADYLPWIILFFHDFLRGS